MSTIRKFAAQVRWRWVMPAFMASVTFALTCRAVYEYSQPSCPVHGLDMPGDMKPLPLLLAAALNGPGFVPLFSIYRLGFDFGDSYIELGWLPALVAFWFWFGMLLEWKLKSPDRMVMTEKWVRLAIFGFLEGLCVFLLVAEIEWLRFHQMLPFNEMFRDLVSALGWWAPNLSTYPRLVWTVIGIAYFSTKLWRTFRSHPRSAIDLTT